MDKKYYYRAIKIPESDKCNCGLLEPKFTDVEATDEKGYLKFWAPIVNEPPIFPRQTEKVLCFSETPGGAIVGAVTGEEGFNKGRYIICKTKNPEAPDVDLSKELVGDFFALKEVRFKRPVKTECITEIRIDDKTIEEIASNYEEGFVSPNLLKVIDKINKQIQ